MNARVGLGVGKGVLFRELSSVQECPHRERSTDSTLVKAIVNADHLCISEFSKRFLSQTPDLIHYHPKNSKHHWPSNTSCSVLPADLMKALKCKTLGGILRCRLTNALSRQLALLAEPKNPLDSTMSTSSGFFVHTMKHCYATALRYHYTCAYKFTARSRA